MLWHRGVWWLSCWAPIKCGCATTVRCQRYLELSKIVASKQGCNDRSRRCLSRHCLVEVRSASNTKASTMRLPESSSWQQSKDAIAVAGAMRILASNFQQRKDAVIAAGAVCSLIALRSHQSSCARRISMLRKDSCSWFSAKQGSHHCSRCCASTSCFVKVGPAGSASKQQALCGFLQMPLSSTKMPLLQQALCLPSMFY